MQWPRFIDRRDGPESGHAAIVVLAVRARGWNRVALMHCERMMLQALPDRRRS
jgi:hypothetical protein